MDMDQFWATIEEARPTAEHDLEKHADQLTELLVDRGVEATVEFADRFQAAMDQLYMWDLWGAAYLAFAGCGDDSFVYLRCWIISNGRRTWEEARRDPEGFFVRLLGSVDSPEDRWETLGLHDGEPILYAAGAAHERLIGSWTPPSSSVPVTEPAGSEWSEDELPLRFPRLYDALPDDWWDIEDVDQSARFSQMEGGLLGDLLAGLDAIGRGDHRTSQAILEPLLDDPEAWTEVVEIGLAEDVGYSIGANRMMAGDMRGAKAAFEAALDATADEPGHIRRGLAQVDLAMGDLDAARTRLDRSEDAHRLDRVLTCLLLLRTRHTETAVAAARSVLDDVKDSGHPWDAAGAAWIAGHVLVETEDASGAGRASALVDEFTADAPEDLPLVGQAAILRAGVARLNGDPDSAPAILRPMLVSLQGADRGHAQVELARAATLSNRSEVARQHYREAITSFQTAGETWLAAATEVETDGLADPGPR